MTYRPSLAIALLVLGGTASAGTEPAPPPAVDATLTVRLTAGKSTYAMGEIIPLELEFRGRAGPDYFFSPLLLDRPDGTRALRGHARGRSRRPSSGVLLLGRGRRQRPLGLAPARRNTVRLRRPTQRVGPVHEAGRVPARGRVDAARSLLARAGSDAEIEPGRAPHRDTDARVGLRRGGPGRRGPRGAGSGHRPRGDRDPAAPRHEGRRARPRPSLRHGRHPPSLRLDRRPRRLATPRGDRGGHGGAGRRRRAAPGRLRAGPGAPALLPRPSRRLLRRPVRAPEGRGVRLRAALGRGPRPRHSHHRGARSRPGGARGAPRAAVRDEPPRAPRGSPGHRAGGLPGPPAADAGPAARVPLERHRGSLDPAGTRGRLRQVARRLSFPRGGGRCPPSPRRDGPRAGPLAGDRRDPDRCSRARPRDADLAPRRVRPGPRRGPAAALSSRPHRGGPVGDDGG